MILSITFENSNSKICADYYKLDYKRFISNNVKDESFAVIERMRLISIDLLEHIKAHITSRNVSLVNLDFQMNIIKKNYLYKFKNDKYVFNIEKEKFINIINDLFEEYYDEIRFALINNDLELANLSSKLRDTFKEYNRSVNKFLKNFELFQAILDENLKNSITNIEIHDTDAVLLNDCYFKSKEINEKIVFITQDKDILNKSVEIKNLLNNYVYVFKPSFFVNN